jgi:hypothetical protein
LNVTGIEFRIGRTDHHKVEEFLAGHPAGVGAVRIDIKNLRIHQEAAAAATAIGAAVYVEPMTERFFDPGFTVIGIPYKHRYLSSLSGLATDRGEQARFAEEVAEPQLPVATALTPAHLHVDSGEMLDLNISLVRQTIAVFGADHAVRPVLSVASTYLREHSAAIARRYADAGVTQLDVRVSPFGGDNVGPIAIRRVYGALADFRAAGLQVTLGMAGTAGLGALALGLVDAISTGVGYREQYNHRGAMSSQRAHDDRDADASGGNPARVVLPIADALLPRDVARHLYSVPTIRSQLICRIGHCGNTLDGPSADLRGHYLHMRAQQVTDLLRQPAAWRPLGLRAHLIRARELRERLVPHLPAGATLPSTRTLDTLIAELERRSQQRRSA